MKKVLVAAIAALAIGVSGSAASAADQLKVGFIYLGPLGDFGWTYQHEVGRLAHREGVRRQDRDHLSRERQRRPRLRARDRATGALRPQADLHDLVRLHGPDPQGRQEVSERLLRAHHRLQARQERLDLFGPLLRGPLHPGPDRGQDVEGGRARLHRLVPDPGGDVRHQRHHARRAVDQSEHQGQDHLGELLVRPGQGGRRRQGAARPGRRRADAAHRQPGRDAGRRATRRVRLRPGLRHDQVRPEGPAHRDRQQLGAVLHRARPGRCSTASGRPPTPGAG